MSNFHFDLALAGVLFAACDLFLVVALSLVCFRGTGFLEGLKRLGGSGNTRWYRFTCLGITPHFLFSFTANRNELFIRTHTFKTASRNLITHRWVYSLPPAGERKYRIGNHDINCPLRSVLDSCLLEVMESYLYCQGSSRAFRAGNKAFYAVGEDIHKCRTATTAGKRNGLILPHKGGIETDNAKKAPGCSSQTRAWMSVLLANNLVIDVRRALNLDGGMLDVEVA